MFIDFNKFMERVRIGEYLIKFKVDILFKELLRIILIFKREILDKEIGNLFENGFIEKLNSLWFFLLFLV